MKSVLCEMLGIDFPLVAFSHCRNVVASVSRAGGFGVLGATAFTPHELELDIGGDGTIPGLDQSLQATAQRVTLYDGSLRTRTAADGGFELRARLPIRTAALA